MSEYKDPDFNLLRAAAYNSRAAKSVGWQHKIPPQAIEASPLLISPADSTAFADGVFHIQQLLFQTDPAQWDGKLGRGTWRAILRAFDRVEDLESYIVFNGRRLRLPSGRSYRVINFDQPGGLDLHREADWQRGRDPRQPLDKTIAHWAGGVFRAQTLFNYFENAVFNDAGVIIEDPRNVSSHGAIELSEDGVVTVYQWIDAWHRTWHGGLLNPRSTGWDILVDPREKFFAMLRRWGWDVELRPNPTHRGPRRYVSMDPRMALGCREFFEDLGKVLGFGELLIPLGEDGLQDKGEPFDGVIERTAWKYGLVKANFAGHHHGSSSKKDVACYMHEMFPRFYTSVARC